MTKRSISFTNITKFPYGSMKIGSRFFRKSWSSSSPPFPSYNQSSQCGYPLVHHLPVDSLAVNGGGTCRIFSFGFGRRLCPQVQIPLASHRHSSCDLKHHLALNGFEWIDLSEHLYDIYKKLFFSVIMEVSTSISFRSFPWEKSNCSVAHLARHKNPLDHTEGDREDLNHRDQLCDKQQNGHFKLS